MIDSYNLQEIMKMIMKYTICYGSNVSEIYFSFIMDIFISFPVFILLTCRIPAISSVENTVDPGQLASKKPADLELHCLEIG